MKRPWAVTAAAVTGVAGAVLILVSLAAGARAQPWETAIQVSALIIWILYGTGMTWLYWRLQRRADQAAAAAAWLFRGGDRL